LCSGATLKIVVAPRYLNEKWGVRRFSFGVVDAGGFGFPIVISASDANGTSDLWISAFVLVFGLSCL
jgi:hypothetical protein